MTQRIAGAGFGGRGEVAVHGEFFQCNELNIWLESLSIDN